MRNLCGRRIVFDLKWRQRKAAAGGRLDPKSPQLGGQAGMDSFGRDEGGSIAILFALTSFVVMALVGGAVDYGRAVTARDQMQNALDAAVLASARIWQTEKSLSLAEEKAVQYFENNKPHGVTSGISAFTPDLQRNSITLRATATVNAPFLAAASAISGLAGGHGRSLDTTQYTVTAMSEALLAVGGNGETNLEISMMLDVTGSMKGSKIDDLKAAAKDLIDIVVWQDQSEFTSKVALVPFADAVNLGSTALVNSVRGNLKTGSCTSSNSPCTAFTTGSPSSTQWTTGAPAKYYKFTRPDNKSNTWQAASYCVTERIGVNKFTDVAPDVAANKVAPLYGSDSASKCGYMEIDTNDLEVNSIQPLTNNKDLLNRRIDKLKIAGSTAGQMGTAWAWYMLSPNWAYLWPSANRPTAYHTDKVDKIAILMTDGEYNTGHCNGVVAKDSGDGSGGNESKINCNANNGKSDPQADSLCAAMKNNTGITVYTVGFALGGNQTAINTLKACASDDTKFYDAKDGDELRMAFRDIALQVARLRLSQ
jgi:Flp pilus assembly protein TadG